MQYARDDAHNSDETGVRALAVEEEGCSGWQGGSGEGARDEDDIEQRGILKRILYLKHQHFFFSSASFGVERGWERGLVGTFYSLPDLVSQMTAL